MASFDAIKELGNLLRSAGAALSYDPGRNSSHPCTFCGRPPPKLHDLRTIGRYPGGKLITRPVCGECKPIADELERIEREFAP